MRAPLATRASGRARVGRDVIDQTTELGQVDWLDDVHLEARLPARLHIAVAAIPAEGDEPRFAGNSSEPPRDVEPAPVGQAKIADDDIPGFTNEIDGFLEVVRHPQMVTIGPQHRRQHLHGVHIIVYDQNANLLKGPWLTETTDH